MARQRKKSPLAVGAWPTPLWRGDLVRLCAAPEASELWIKNEGVSHPRYGGNKVRKLEWILAEARERGARRIVTFGAAGSHHVLATAVHAGEAGIGVAAVLFPQPWSEHAEQTLRASLALGVEAHPAASLLQAPIVAARVLRRGDRLVPPGGSSVAGTCGWIDAARELLDQLGSGAVPEPELVLVPLGSGGTAAGLLAGLAAAGSRARVVAVRVVPSRVAGRAMVVALAARAARAAGLAVPIAELSARLEVDPSFLGRGYGWPTAEGEHATEVAQRLGLALDPTYTAKTFAAVLARIGAGARAAARPARSVLYWHTLNAAPLAPLLPREPQPLPRELERLLLR